MLLSLCSLELQGPSKLTQEKQLSEKKGPTQHKAIVTGASSGIGAAVAARLRALGYRVVGVSRRDGRADHGLEKQGDFSGVAIDLAALDSLPQRLEDLRKEHGDCDLLVLSAGRGDFGSLEELSYRRIRSLIELNLIATIFVCRAFLPAMKRRGRGHVVIIGSEAALRGGARGAVYSASKFGLRGLAQALRQEGAKSGVRVTIIQPGMVASPFFDGLDFEPGENEDNYLLPVDVADAVALAVTARSSAVVDEIELSPLKRVVRKKR